MAQDIIKPVGATKASKPDSGGGAIRNVPVLGIVKNNIDPTRAGRIQVYIADIGNADPEDANSWVTVSYMSPFYGLVSANSGDTGYGDYISNSSSYGLWNSPPDIGTTVICVFINGDPTYGYYIGCVPKVEALHMVPAIGASDKIVANNEGEAQGYGGATRLPVTNINTNNAALAEGANFLKEPKPIHSYTAMIMNQQGIIRDPLRGPISSSAQRESPSRVGWGVSTPGRPIYEGGFTDENITDAIASDGTSKSLKVIARRGGHSIVMDDGDLLGQDQLVRIRTAKGHQILMSDDGQTLFILHSNGQSYIELGKEGTIDMYSTNSVNIRTQGDLNLHADNNININAAKKLNIHAENINLHSDQETTHKIGSNYKLDTAGTFTHKVAGPMSMQSSGDASYASSASTFINGSKVNLNTGSTSTTPAAVPAIPLQAHTDTLFDSVKGFAAAPGKLLSITSRAPAHAPWANAGQGVNVKTSLNASNSLPANPSPKVAAANETAAKTPVTQPVTTANTATVPSVPNVSKSIDKTTAAAMVASVAQNAAYDPATAAAIRAGTSIVTNSSGQLTGAIGVLAQTPKLLETAGVLKPGSAALINTLIQSGKNITKAMPSNLFTGQMGANDVLSVAKNVTVQVQSQVANFQRAQSALTRLGVISGKESSGSIAGLVMSGSNVGLSQTMNVVRTVSTVTSGIQGASNVVNAATKAINSGNYAALLSQSTLNGLASVATAVDAVERLGMGASAARSKGTTGAAFLTILSQFKSLKVGVPQDLRAIAQEAAEARASARTNEMIATVGGIIGKAAGLPSASVGAITGVVNSVNTLTKAKTVGTMISAGTSLVKNISKIVNTMSSASYASGINNLPGGQTIISAGTSAIPGTKEISTLIKNYSSAATNGISVPNSITSSLGAAGGTLTNAVSSVNASVSGALNKLNSGAATLSNLATAGLPPAAVAELNAAVSSMSSTSASPINIPTVGVDTNDRTEQSVQIASLLGDPRIPTPNFNGGVSEAAVSKLLAISSDSDMFTGLVTKVNEQLANAKELQNAYYDAINQYPKGSPEIEAAKQKWIAAVNEATALNMQITDRNQA